MRQAAEVRQQLAGEKQGVTSAGATDSNDALTGMLAGIADEAQRHGAAVCAGIMADFAARMQNACRTARPHELAGILKSLRDARAAALAGAQRIAEDERRGSQRAAMRDYVHRPPRPARRERPGGCSNG